MRTYFIYIDSLKQITRKYLQVILSKRKSTWVGGHVQILINNYI